MGTSSHLHCQSYKEERYRYQTPESWPKTVDTLLGLNIRILNLSYGTNSTQAYDVDPLAHAVEQAWKNGIVVVAAAGNTGYQRGNDAPGLADPAYNPFVVGVGGYDTNGTMARARPASYCRRMVKSVLAPRIGCWRIWVQSNSSYSSGFMYSPSTN